MIEFKAECGHTVRARDEDGGGVVRCSYCGKPANVPEGSGDDLDFLFNDVEQDANEPKRAKRRRGKSKRAAKGMGGPGEFNPFAVVLRLCYAALLIIIVLVVGQWFVIPLFQEGGVAKRTSGSEKTGRGIVDAPGEDPGSSKATSGRKRQARPGTLYAGSTPAGARIFCIKADEAPPEGRIHRARNVTTCANEICKARGYGVFVVEVAIPVRHPDLRLGPGYLDFRRRLKNATKDKLRQQAAEEYFIPDGSVLLVDRAEGQEYIVRQYRNIELRRDRATVVNALFLPRIPRASGRGYSIDELIKDAFIPVGEKYAFNVADVTSELQSIYEIDQPERDAIVEALRRIGAISFATDDGKTRLFKIDPQNGWLAVDEIADPRR
ncbi:MAG: hypothetical protein IH897_08645 [Planctomycetes bacterium]|nr:hypothetical protein [Planctomycetota bacterium]